MLAGMATLDASATADPWALSGAAILPFDLDHRFAVGPGWGRHPDTLPEGWSLGQVAGVATHPSGEVFVFQRGRHADPLLVFDLDGRFLRSFGKGLIRVAHSVRIDPAGDVWLVDQEAHEVHRFTRDGERLLTLGERDVAGPDVGRFDQPTDVAFGPDGRIFVSDGYGNSRVVVYSADGRATGTWGSFGTAPGAFDTPHSIAVDPDGLVYVADRSNERIQVFGPDGDYRTEWQGLGAVSGITITGDGECWIVTARVVRGGGIRRGAGCRVLQLDLQSGEVVGGLEALTGHMVATSAWGHLFVASLAGNVLRWTPWSERTEELR
jgi:DNA-binding beta-propeller fold protein YncE